MSKTLSFQELSEQDLKQIAADLFHGKIYCDQHIKSEEGLPRVFLPIMAGAFEGVALEELKKMGFIYEYLDKQIESTKGSDLPRFDSFKILSVEQAKQMFVYFESYKTLQSDFMTKPIEEPPLIEILLEEDADGKDKFAERFQAAFGTALRIWQQIQTNKKDEQKETWTHEGRSTTLILENDKFRVEGIKARWPNLNL